MFETSKISINLKIINNHLSVKRKRSPARFTMFFDLLFHVQRSRERTHTGRVNFEVWIQYRRTAERRHTNYKRIHRVFSISFLFSFLNWWRLYLITNELSISRFSKEMNRNQIQVRCVHETTSFELNMLCDTPMEFRFIVVQFIYDFSPDDNKQQSNGE